MTSGILRASTALAGIVILPVAALAGPTGNLFISSSNYAGNPATVTVGQPLPNTNGATAIADGTYPTVFNNVTVDANFGVTSPIFLQAYGTRTNGRGVMNVGKLLQTVDLTGSGIVTSFSSKSELGLTISPDGSALTLMGYATTSNRLDVSNSDTPGFTDPTNTDTQTPTYRAVLQYDLGQNVAQITQTPAYSGNNPRNVVLAPNANGSGTDEYLMAGNAGNGSSPPPIAIVQDTGVQLTLPGVTPGTASTVVGVEQGNPGDATGFQYGFSVTQLGYAADKSGKDNNYRGLTVFNNTLYVSKGSGSNGVNSIFEVDVPGGGLPTADTASQAVFNIPAGLPTDLATTSRYHPFGIFFADANTLYVADEGLTDGSPDAFAGLQKWKLVNGTWTLAYVLRQGLNIGQPYQVTNYPSQYAPSTVGLRNLAGSVNNGIVTLFAVTATTSSLGDPGADPNQVVKIVDPIDATGPTRTEEFKTIAGPTAFTVYRGVAWAPCSEASCKAPLARVARIATK